MFYSETLYNKYSLSTTWRVVEGRSNDIIIYASYHFNLLHRRILNQSLKRPVSIVGNEMHYITSTIVDKRLLPVILVSI